jgi:hypothetical protein
MDTNHYILMRLGAAKMVGLVVGLVAFFMIPAVWPEGGMWLRVGVLLWYTTVGAVIGVFGLISHHPMFGFRMTWWFRGLFVGAWFNLVLAFLMRDELEILMQQLGGVFGGLSSPFWVVLEGAVIGLIIDAIATRIAGEGMPSQSAET